MTGSPSCPGSQRLRLASAILLHLPAPKSCPMAKARLTAYVCNECGAEYSKWQGQCTECNAWNSLSEIVLESAAAAKAPASRRAGWAGTSAG